MIAKVDTIHNRQGHETGDILWLLRLNKGGKQMIDNLWDSEWENRKSVPDRMLKGILRMMCQNLIESGAECVPKKVYYPIQ